VSNKQYNKSSWSPDHSSVKHGCTHQDSSPLLSILSDMFNSEACVCV